MKLINIKCPNCNATLKIGEHRKRVKCDYCEKTFMIDDEIVKVKHLNVGEITEEQEFINAETNLNKLKNYKDAYKGYWSLSKRYVDDPEIWIGLVRSMTHDFTYKSNEPAFKELCMKYWNYFVALSDKKEVDKYMDKYVEYCNEGQVKNDEVKFVPESEKKKKVNVVQYAFFGLLLMGAFVELPYTFLAFLIFVIAAILCLDVVWRKAKYNQVALRIAVPFIVFIIGTIFATSAIPEEYYGMWVTSDSNAPVKMIEITSAKTKIYDENKKELEEVESTYLATTETIFVDGEKYDYELVFNADKGGLCVVDGDNDCKYLYLIEVDVLDIQ